MVTELTTQVKVKANRRIHIARLLKDMEINEGDMIEVTVKKVE